jgi:hypothetical protein
MTDPLKAFMQGNALSAPVFEPGSRYHGSDTAQWTRPDGELLVYARRRFIPPPDQFATQQEHRVQGGDRVDNLAAHYLGDPQQYWQLCDGNGAMRPAELTATVGKRLRITLPAGVPGLSGADDD